MLDFEGKRTLTFFLFLFLIQFCQIKKTLCSTLLLRSQRWSQYHTRYGYYCTYHRKHSLYVSNSTHGRAVMAGGKPSYGCCGISSFTPQSQPAQDRWQPDIARNKCHVVLWLELLVHGQAWWEACGDHDSCPTLQQQEQGRTSFFLKEEGKFLLTLP